MMPTHDHAPDFAETAKSAAEPDPPVRRNVDRLDKELSNLDHSFALLADRLMSVLTPESDDGMAKASDPEPPMSDLARKVLFMAEQAGRLAARMDDIRHRVEV